MVLDISTPSICDYLQKICIRSSQSKSQHDWRVSREAISSTCLLKMGNSLSFGDIACLSG